MVTAGARARAERAARERLVTSLLRELDPVTQQMHWAVKNALDPQGILNPGKMFAELQAADG